MLCCKSTQALWKATSGLHYNYTTLLTVDMYTVYLFDFTVRCVLQQFVAGSQALWRGIVVLSIALFAHCYAFSCICAEF